MATQHTLNGVDVEKLENTIEEIKKDPGLAQCRFKARNRWIGGGHNQAKIKAFYGARQEIPHQQPFTMEIMNRRCCSAKMPEPIRSSTCCPPSPDVSLRR